MTDVNKDVGFPEEIVHTHKATITVFSNGENEMITVRVSFAPDMDGADIEALGYEPAAFGFVQDYIIPAIDEAQLEWEAGPLLELPSPSRYNN